MKGKNSKELYVSISFILAFVLWTFAVSLVDVKAIGPQNSSVGFATVNGYIHNLFGVHMTLYVITDWLSLVPAVFIASFGLLGFVQLIKRKSIAKVDHSILVLGGFYIGVMAIYILFEFMVINYRPVLINGVLEASYPSSTTMLVLCVVPTAVMQIKSRINNIILNKFVSVGLMIFTVFMITARLISGVHWFTDIVGGTLISCGFVVMYCYLCKLVVK